MIILVGIPIVILIISTVEPLSVVFLLLVLYAENKNKNENEDENESGCD